MAKSMSLKEVRELTPEKMAVELVETKKKQFEARVTNSTGQLKNTAELKGLRRHYARLMTVCKEKEAK